MTEPTDSFRLLSKLCHRVSGRIKWRHCVKQLLDLLGNNCKICNDLQ